MAGATSLCAPDNVMSHDQSECRSFPSPDNVRLPAVTVPAPADEYPQEPVRQEDDRPAVQSRLTETARSGMDGQKPPRREVSGVAGFALTTGGLTVFVPADAVPATDVTPVPTVPGGFPVVPAVFPARQTVRRSVHPVLPATASCAVTVLRVSRCDATSCFSVVSP